MTVKIEQAFTHGGKFHADDVFSAAVLTLMNPDIQIERGFHVPEEFNGLVFDIGFGEFDHHQADKKIRENGVVYAAFGLIWEKFGDFFLDEEDKKIFDEKFVQPLDDSDNYGTENEIAKLISKFNPSWDEKTDENECFHRAKQFAMTILNNEFRYMKGVSRATKLVTELLPTAKNGILVLDQYVPYKKSLEGTDIDFVIYPSKRGGYCAQSLSLDEDREVLKYSFPQEWRGKSCEELKNISNIKTLSFCHNSGFLLSAATVEDCILACEYTREHVERGTSSKSETRMENEKK